MEEVKTKLTLSLKKDLVRRIGLSKKKKAHIEIFRVIVDNKIEYTLNGNVVFFNLSAIDDGIISQIDIVVKKFK